MSQPIPPAPTPSDEPADVPPFGRLTQVLCRECAVQMNFEIERTKMAVSKSVITCMSYGCKERGKLYKCPTVALEPV